MAFIDTGKLTGGLAQYLADDLIVPLNDSIDQYMPNLSAFLAENPAHSKQARLDDGNDGVFPHVHHQRQHHGHHRHADSHKLAGKPET
jgi:hypothetical protein